MEMTLRWYGPGYDSVYPGADPADSRSSRGWLLPCLVSRRERCGPMRRSHSLRRWWRDAGLKIAAIESVNVSDDIKIGTAKREEHIANYITTLENLAKNDIHIVCYNFMPVFDWTRTDLARVRPDGSTVLAYNQDIVDQIDPEHMKESRGEDVQRLRDARLGALSAWSGLKELFEMYKDVDSEKLFDNLVYFLKAIGPVLREVRYAHGHSSR